MTGKKLTAKERCEKMRKFAYNKETREYFGRTCQGWCLILAFYIVFYSILFGFWFGMMKANLEWFVKNDEPSLTGEQSLLKLNPGLSVFPRSNISSSLIDVNLSPDSASFKYYASNFTRLNQIYENKSKSEGANEQNQFKFASLGPCADPAAELRQGRLCIYVTINRIYGWLPYIELPDQTNNTLIYCSGQNFADEENLGEPTYYPSIKLKNGTFGYIESKFFPYTNRPAYQKPIVAVRFEKISKNVLIFAKCTLLNSGTSMKPTTFEILLESSPVSKTVQI